MAFECSMCGRCCRGSGFLPLRKGEAGRLAAANGTDLRSFRREHRLLWQPPGSGWAFFMPVRGACPFLTREGRCSVYSVRPSFCRGFPDAMTPEERDMARSRCPLDLGV